MTDKVERGQDSKQLMGEHMPALCKNGVLLALFIFFSGCVSPYKATEIKTSPIPPLTSKDNKLPGPFYVSGRSEDVDYVWQGDPTIGLLPVYASPARYPASLLPSMDLAMFSQCPNAPDVGCTLPSFSLNHGIHNVQLSPNKRYLAWLDSIAHCVSSRCYGSEKIIVWDLIAQESKTLFEYPYTIHQAADQAVTDLVWSPDSGRLGYVQFSHLLGWARVRMVELHSAAITSIGEGTINAQFSWSPSGNQIAISTLSEKRKPVVTIERWGENLSRTIMQDWAEVSDIDWSPDGRYLAITARPNQPGAAWGIYLADESTGDISLAAGLTDDFEIETMTWSPDGKFIAVAAQGLMSSREKRVYLLTLENQAMTQVVVNNLWMDNPKWSPDARVLAVNIYPIGNSFSNGIAVIQPADGKTEAQLQVSGASTGWVWSPDSKALLLDLQDTTLNCSSANLPRIGLFYWEDNHLEPIPIHMKTMSDQPDCTFQLWDLIW